MGGWGLDIFHFALTPHTIRTLTSQNWAHESHINVVQAHLIVKVITVRDRFGRTEALAGVRMDLRFWGPRRQCLGIRFPAWGTGRD